MSREPASEAQLAWERTQLRAITSDVLWKLDVYRSALFLLHCVRADLASIPSPRVEDAIRAQLLEAAGSVSANIGEGYGRGTRTDRLRFLGYALSSDRECISWYEALRDVLPAAVVDERQELIARIRALLLGLIRSTRNNGGDRGFES